jgi:hypothetical protein
MWILETGVSSRDNNFSILFEVKLGAFMEKISRIEENHLIIISNFRNICLIYFSMIGENCVVSSPNFEKIDPQNF